MTTSDRRAGRPSSSSSPRGRHRLPLLTAAAATTAGLSFLLPIGDRSATSATRSGDVAWVQTEVTRDLVRQIESAVPRLFSVTPGTVAQVRRAGSSDLIGAATEQYQTLYGPVLRRARDGLSLETVVRAVGVQSLSDGTAEVLVLADQQVSVEGASEAGAAQIRLRATLREGAWLISGIDVL
jgi:Mce-associated membrane protein